jgi:threonine dehydrogenase-like Zn-dependent dehydrogenase
MQRRSTQLTSGVRNGTRAEQQKVDPPLYVPGTEAAGIVDAVGSGVPDRLKVVTPSWRSWCRKPPLARIASKLFSIVNRRGVPMPIGAINH